MSYPLGRYGENGDKPLTNQPAPTTSTVGYLGEVRFDTDGNKWELIKIIGSTYYWKVDGYPASNTPYFSYFDSELNKPVYKIKLIGTTPASAVTGSYPIPATNENSYGLSIIGTVDTGTVSEPLPTYFASSQIRLLSRFETSNNVLNMTIFPTDSPRWNKPFVAYVEFING